MGNKIDGKIGEKNSSINTRRKHEESMQNGQKEKRKSRVYRDGK